MTNHCFPNPIGGVHTGIILEHPEIGTDLVSLGLVDLLLDRGGLLKEWCSITRQFRAYQNKAV
jgi:hypothetical protein